MDQYLGVGVGRDDALHGFDTRQARHLNIHQNQIGPVFPDFGYGVIGVFVGTGQIHIVRALKIARQALPQTFVVFKKDDGDHKARNGC